MYVFSTFYFIMNIAYCLKLKQIEIIDVFIISSGFVIRIFIGSYITDIWISEWIIIMTFLLALFLAFAKRRDDVYIYIYREREREKKCIRESVTNYSLQFLDLILGVNASIIVVCYIMYTISDEVIMRVGTPYLYITSIFVLFGIIRYLQITMVKHESGSPTLIFIKDKFILSTVILWVLCFLIIIYL